jgi:3-phenylpropionate/cinnamic acid dioxygenase small subunit
MDEVSEISQLFARYAAALDDETFDELPAFFTDDAQWSCTAFPSREMVACSGRESVCESISTSRAEGITRHFLSNLLIHVTEPEWARVSTYLFFTVVTEDAVTALSTGRYRADVTRDGGGWRFRRLELTLDSNYRMVDIARSTEPR